MSSDRARITFDPSRHWRGVISQQGRVTIESDANESAAIATAERRAELLGMLGPSGTPDDGYKVLPGPSASAPGDLALQAGTMYVGGERMTLEAPLDYAHQPDWLDVAGDPLWAPPAIPAGGATELVYLMLREQEVSSVEDPALIDIALGGPDTSARRRILQRVVRASTNATDSRTALAALTSEWASRGLAYDPNTSRLRSQATLQVSFETAPGAPSLCEPSGQGGYVGAENQLIRVQVASVDAGGTPTLVWGYDNASFMYRIAGPLAAGATTITLASAPVDSFHQPAKGQAVEVLEAAAMLSPGDISGYIAAASGAVTAVSQPYDPGSRQVQLTAGLTDQQAASPLLFLRVWQDTITYTGGAVPLGQTGLTITLTKGGGSWHVGDYWTFAVRPGTPITLSPVYPERILAAPQPPDGPEMWASPLALVQWSANTPTITDLRRQFADLVTVTEQAHGCCTVQITPDAVDGGASLQALVDAYASLGPTTICFRPGTYKLPAPLFIKAGVAPLTLEACMGGVVLEAAQSSSAFTLGLIVAESATAAAGAGATTTAAPQSTPIAGASTPAPETVTQLEDAPPFTVRGMVLSMPAIPFSFPSSAIQGLPAQRQALLTGFGNNLQASIGIAVHGCSNVTVEQCRFYFPDVGSANLFAAGIYATGATAGVKVSQCSFINLPEPTASPFSQMRLGTLAAPPYQACFGYLQMPTPPPPSTGITATAVSGPATREFSPVQRQALWRAAPRARLAGAFEAPSVTERVEGSSPSTAETAATTPQPAHGFAGAFARAAHFMHELGFGTTPPPQPGRSPFAAGELSPFVPAPANPIRVFTPSPGSTIHIFTTPPEPDTSPGDTVHTTASTTTTTTTPGPTTTAGPPPPLTLSNPVLEDGTFTRNTFDGVTVPVLVLGDIGVVSVSENTVRACYGGFWFVPADGDTAVALLDVFDPSDPNASGYAARFGITALTDPVLWLGTALARLLPLRPPPPTGPPVIANIALPRNLLHGASTLLQRLGDILPSSTAPATGGPATAAQVRQGVERIGPIGEGTFRGIGVIDTPAGEAGIHEVAQPIRQLAEPPSFIDIFRPTRAVAPPQPIPPADVGLGRTPRLDFHANTIDAMVETTYSGTGLLVAVMLTDGTIVSVLCNGNRIRGRVSAGPTVSFNQVAQCTLTGNLISNEIFDPSAPATPEASVPPPTSGGGTTPASGTTPAPPAPSQSLVLNPAVAAIAAASGAPGVPLVAVTGNVLIGDPPTLPTRASMPSPFGVWDPLNTIVAYPTPPTTTTTTTTTAAVGTTAAPH